MSDGPVFLAENKLCTILQGDPDDLVYIQVGYVILRLNAEDLKLLSEGLITACENLAEMAKQQRARFTVIPGDKT